MKVRCFSKKINENDAMQIASKKGSFLGGFLVKGEKEINIKEIYIENKIITYDVSFMPIPFMKNIFKSKEKDNIKIKVIANGSTGGVAYYDEEGVDIKEVALKEDSLQFSDFNTDKLITKGNILVRRILRRRIGGNMKIEAIDVKSIYRPYYVAFFGKLIEGKKIRYLPISADGCNVKKTF